MLATCVDQHEVAVGERTRVVAVMEDVGVVAAADDGAVSGTGRAVTPERVLDANLEFRFAHAGPRRPHEIGVRRRRDAWARHA